MIEYVEIKDHQDDPPSVIARFWWSAARGLTTDNPRLLALLVDEGGILVPPGDRLVLPGAGREFLAALPYRFTGLERASAPVTVEQQGGESAR